MARVSVNEQLTAAQRDRVEGVVHVVGRLHDADWGDFSLDAVRALVDRHPGWTIGEPGPFEVSLKPGGDARHEAVVSAEKHGVDAVQYGMAQVWLGDDWTGADFAALVEALSSIGTPTVHRCTTTHPTLRWRNQHRVMLLQCRVLQTKVKAWLAIHPTATGGRSVPSATLEAAAQVAGVLHDARSALWSADDLARWAAAREDWEFTPSADSPGGRLRVGGIDGVELGVSGYVAKDGNAYLERFRLLDHAPGAVLAERRAVFSELFDAVVGGIGQPTVYGGSASGPDIRWRTGDRLLILQGDGTGAWLTGQHTETREDDEHRTFKWGGAWSPSEPSDFRHLPYLWQLDRYGPGDSQTVFPGGRLAVGMEHLREALELMMAAWIEQIPAQLGRDWASFTIVHRGDGDRHLRVSYDLDDGLSLMVDDRDGDGSAESAVTMRGRGWQRRDRNWWRAVFPEPTQESAAAAAGLIVADLRARAEVKNVEDTLRLRDVSLNDIGDFRLCGVGMTS